MSLLIIFRKVTILAGFLGSGKTTFRREGTTMIERIIKMGTLQSKIAIIQNEFSLNMGIGKYMFHIS